MKKRFKISIFLLCFSMIFMVPLLFYAQDQGKKEENGDKKELESTQEIDQDTLSDDLKYLEDQKLKALKEREAIISKKELKIAEEEKQLKKLKDEIEAKTNALMELQKKLNAMVDKISTESNGRFLKIVKIYESMKEDNAANVLLELYQKDKETVIEVIKVMQPRKSGKILDSMARIDKKIAADLSFELGKKP